jgi:hypothetical protein
MLTVGTTGPTAAGLHSRADSRLSYAVWLPLIGLVLAGVRVGSSQRRKQKTATVVLACILGTGLVFQVACGGGSTMNSVGGGTPAGAYAITVTGTSGSLQHSTTTMLTIQ